MSIQFAGLQKLKIFNHLNVSCMNNKPCGNIDIIHWSDLAAHETCQM